MPRPAIKSDLIKTANEQFDELWKLIDSIAEKEQEADFNFGEDFLQKQKEAHWVRDRNLRDILVHLYEWHQLLINWVNFNQNGESKSFIPKPYNFKTYGQMNIMLWEKHQTTSYEKSKTMLKESHKKVMDLIEQFTNEKLFAKKHFAWTGTSTLGSYCVSATSSHYDWAIKKVKKHIKLCLG